MKNLISLPVSSFKHSIAEVLTFVNHLKYQRLLYLLFNLSCFAYLREQSQMFSFILSGSVPRLTRLFHRTDKAVLYCVLIFIGFACFINLLWKLKSLVLSNNQDYQRNIL